MHSLPGPQSDTAGALAVYRSNEHLITYYIACSAAKTCLNKVPNAHTVKRLWLHSVTVLVVQLYNRHHVEAVRAALAACTHQTVGKAVIPAAT